MEGRCTEENFSQMTVLQVSESGWRRLRLAPHGWGRRVRPFVFYWAGRWGVGRERVKGPLHNPSTSARFATMLRSACVAEFRSPRIQRAAPRTAPESSET